MTAVTLACGHAAPAEPPAASFDQQLGTTTIIDEVADGQISQVVA